MATRLSQSTRLLRTTAPSSLANSRRSLFGFGAKKPKATDPPKPLIAQDDLFHPLSRSPFKEMRDKGERIKQLAYCPVSLDKYGEKTHVAFECPNCGFPTHASEQRWSEDENHARYWPRLREANEDEHDLRSGRELTEFKLPGASTRPTTAQNSLADATFCTSQRNNPTRRPSRSATGTSSCTPVASLRSRPRGRGDTCRSSSRIR